MNLVKTFRFKVFIAKTAQELEEAVNVFMREQFNLSRGFKPSEMSVDFKWTASLVYEIYEEVPDVLE